MKIPKNPIGVGDVQISDLAKKYINTVLKSRRISYGPYSQNFENDFAKMHQIKHAIFTNSGTSALQISIHILKKKYKWQDQDEILVPALGFVATVNVVILNNLKPEFVDVDHNYFEIDPEEIQKKITKKTRAVIVTHIAGQPADMDKILKIAKANRLKIIEDSAQTVFARYKGRSVGSFGDISCFSTYSAHILVSGVGGLICTNDWQLATHARSLINHGRDPIYTNIDDNPTQNKRALKEIIAKRFSFLDIGYSYRLTEFEAALGLANLKNLPKNIKKRIENAHHLTAGLKDLQDFLSLPQTRKGNDHVFMVYPIVLKDKKTRLENLMLFLEENMIETRYLFPLLNQPIYKSLVDAKDYPVSKQLLSSGFYIGCHNLLSRKELDYVIGKFQKYFKNK